jgi:Rieske Fe-S protein
MLVVLGGFGAVIGLVYVGSAARFLYPKNGSETPPLNVMLDANGVIDPQSGSTLPFQNGVAGPLFYPATVDKSVVVGVFVEKKMATSPLTAGNIRVVEETCTHLGCPVSWVANPTGPVEPTGRFECPCHGSQFHRDLSVARSPANVPLYEHEFTLAGTTLAVLKRKA